MSSAERRQFGTRAKRVSVEVRVTSVLQKVVGGKSVQGEGKTIGEVLDAISAQHPGFREQITQEDGSLHRFVNIYVNDEDIRFMEQLNTPVNEGDVVSILPALAGGSASQW
jgi:sulfur-carrier protein